MKKYCKDVIISDRSLISRATYNCLADKYSRNDTMKLFSDISGLHVNQVHCIYFRYGKRALFWIVEAIIDIVRGEILSGELDLPPIFYREKRDSSSFKLRRIGIQNVKQQIYDYIAVEAIRPFLKRIGRYQCASIPGRGQIYGIRAIKRWLKNKHYSYIAKADIKKCYESIDREKLMRFLELHIKNDSILWLIRTLIYTFEQGLSIGSYLSQFLCNLYLSQLYHFIAEKTSKVRKHKRPNKYGKMQSTVRRVHKQLFYMDDLLLIGKSSKDLHKTMKIIIKYAKEKLGLTIKENWVILKSNVCVKSEDKHFVDMMGFRVYRWRVIIRRNVFKRIRRIYMRVGKRIKIHKHIPVSSAKRVISYFGQIKEMNSRYFNKKYNVHIILKKSKEVLKDYAKRVFCRKTETCILGRRQKKRNNNSIHLSQRKTGSYRNSGEFFRNGNRDNRIINAVGV